jgi:hypothetical protein
LPKNAGRNISTGRHNIGANPAPGSGTRPPNRAGQAAPAGNSPTTAQPGFGAPRPPQTNPTNQSQQVQSQISAQPAPFKIPMGLGQKSVAQNGDIKSGNGMIGQKGNQAPKNPPAGPVGGFKPKTLGLTVGVRPTPPAKKGKIKIGGATKGGHSLLYGD